MADTILVVPEDLKAEIEEASRRVHRSEVDVLRDAMRRFTEQLPAQQMDDGTREDPSERSSDSEYVKPSWMLDPRVPQSIGMGSSGRIQSDKVDEWLEKNWERDW